MFVFLSQSWNTNKWKNNNNVSTNSFEPALTGLSLSTLYLYMLVLQKKNSIMHSTIALNWYSLIKKKNYNVIHPMNFDKYIKQSWFIKFVVVGYRYWSIPINLTPSVERVFLSSQCYVCLPHMRANSKCPSGAISATTGEHTHLLVSILFTSTVQLANVGYFRPKHCFLVLKV